LGLGNHQLSEFRLLDLGHLSAAENMALDEVLTRRAGQGLSSPTLRFLQFAPDAALLGYHQEAERELRLDFCRENGIDVNRRLTGGGALLFQSSALGWELIAPQGHGPFSGGFEAALARICLAAARAYSRLGFDAKFRPRNDIEVDGRKISGTGGFVLEHGALFQGTVLIKNEIERFLKALRVPVEKLKKREIESLMQRLAFVEDLAGPIDLAVLKRAICNEFSQSLDITLTPGGLDAGERAELAQRLPYFGSEEWVYLKSPGKGSKKPGPPAWLRQILQTDQGNLKVVLWLDARGLRVQKALITGDFFAQPQRLIMDLEAALMGQKAKPEVLHAVVMEFISQADGELLGIAPEEVAQAVAHAGARRVLGQSFSEREAAELFLVGMSPDEVESLRPGWLLLPYCSKPLECDFRFVADCAQCGDCQFDPLYDLAHDLGLEPVSIQSFEHLMQVLRRIAARGGGFIGSCCEAFYCKHQKEMEQSGAKGVLINLDSTTCYDLGKGMDAYRGRFDNQTEMNQALIEKVTRLMAGKRTHA
jgi:lipoate-protein ligase A